ncbi:TIGR03769 domain-containing protein [Nanchangia anserum]|uniref:TIGR03769 domain-containing protein n=1 Tax=Nanchangia anserum TaxID=2692125 RepID=A0A8I0KNV0_9ACTO|nr:choice-of-anchor M domain-containing protein [Nanchangia anserum]MBD3689676.1 TIGR03769 domain-containing protein [Nanchangia anserum]QOX81853.1 TIGR03769 domain-containing protein [Nanchangia anserum]
MARGCLRKLGRMCAAGVAVGAVAIGTIGSAATPSVAADPQCEGITVIESGHVDAFKATAASGSVTLELGWDNSGDSRTRYEPGHTVIDVPQAAWADNAKAVIGHPAYVLPQVQEANIPWVGWDLMELAQGKFRSADIVLDEVSGPGALRLFIGGNLGEAPRPLAKGKAADDYVVRGGDRLVDGPPLTHKHFYWAFDKAGIYTVSAHIEAHGDAGTTSSARQSYTFAVGGHTGEACQVAKGEKAPSSTPEAGDTTPPPAEHITANTAPAHPDETPAGAPATSPAPAGAGQAAPAPAAPAASTEVCLPKEVTRKVSAEEAEKHRGGGSASRIAVFESGNLGTVVGNVWFTKVGDTHQLPLHTHVHPNWIFPAAGTYRVTLSQSVPLKNGQVVSGKTTLTFIAGGSGTANDGHFDLGAELRGNTLQPMLKDDRKSPPTWVNPESVTFGVGEAGKTAVPAQLGTLGISGTVYMIGSTQKAGVPWVGANTQNESLLAQAAGPVTWKLEDVQGPAGAAGAGGARVTKNADGTYTLTEIAGRTPSGQPCTLHGGLASTGASPLTPAIALFGVALILAGFGGLALRAQLRARK